MGMITDFFTDSYDEDINPKPTYKILIDKALNIVDNGSFFREPIVYVYRIIGILYLPCLLLALYQCYDSFSGIAMMVGNTINVILLIITCIVACILALLFWVNRSNKLRQRIPMGGDMIVMPIVADFIQSFFEITGLISMIFVPVYTLYIGILGQLFIKQYSLYKDVLFMAVSISIGAIILGYVIMAFGHFIAENIRALATITNNIKDLGDIYRASLFQNEEQEISPKNEQEEQE